MNEQNENIQRTIDDPEVKAKMARVFQSLGLDPKAIEGASEAATDAEVAANAADARTTPVQEVQAPETEAASEGALDPSKMDWSQYDLIPSIAHLYPRSAIKMTPEGARFVVVLEVFDFVSKPYSKLGKIVSDAVNGPDQWKLLTVYGDGYGAGVATLVRQQVYALPNPRLLQAEAEMPAAPQEPELQESEDKAVDWIKSQGMTVTEEDQVIPTLPVDVAEAAGLEAAAALKGPDFGVNPQTGATEEADRRNNELDKSRE